MDLMSLMSGKVSGHPLMCLSSADLFQGCTYKWFPDSRDLYDPRALQ